MADKTFTETLTVDDADMDAGYRNTLFRLTNRLNAEPFRGRLPGKCLFLGANGSKRDDGKWDVTLRFSDPPDFSKVGNLTAVDVYDADDFSRLGIET